MEPYLLLRWNKGSSNIRCMEKLENLKIWELIYFGTVQREVMWYKESEWPCKATTEVTCMLQCYTWARGSVAISTGLVTEVEVLRMTVAVEDSAAPKKSHWLPRREISVPVVSDCIFTHCHQYTEHTFIRGNQNYYRLFHRLLIWYDLSLISSFVIWLIYTWPYLGAMYQI